MKPYALIKITQILSKNIVSQHFFRCKKGENNVFLSILYFNLYFNNYLSTSYINSVGFPSSFK
jgi:hypothetical protein